MRFTVALCTADYDRWRPKSVIAFEKVRNLWEAQIVGEAGGVEVGDMEGNWVPVRVGLPLGLLVGDDVDGEDVGFDDVECSVGALVGLVDGATVVGDADGDDIGADEGAPVVGATVPVSAKLS